MKNQKLKPKPPTTYWGNEKVHVSFIRKGEQLYTGHRTCSAVL